MNPSVVSFRDLLDLRGNEVGARVVSINLLLLETHTMLRSCKKFSHTDEVVYFIK